MREPIAGRQGASIAQMSPGLDRRTVESVDYVLAVDAEVVEQSRIEIEKIR
jgi:hypothetical protein